MEVYRILELDVILFKRNVAGRDVHGTKYKTKAEPSDDMTVKTRLVSLRENVTYEFVQRSSTKLSVVKLNLSRVYATARLSDTDPVTSLART